MNKECNFCNKIIKKVSIWGLIADVQGDEMVMCGYCYYVVGHPFDIEDPTQKDFITLIKED
tara:strand:- start:1509 stop:1691 length:183 start_codon:yes stop_codon:yes gene_type:complete